MTKQQKQDQKNTLLLGLDLGTSTIKGMVVSLDGKIITQGKVPAVLERPRSGWVEFSADDYYRTVCRLIRSLNKKVPQGKSIKALAMAAASGNTLLVDDHGRSLINVISWLDNRVKHDEVQFLQQVDRNKLYRTVGWPLVDGFPPVHLAWLKKNKPKIYRRAVHVCMHTDYLLFQLTGTWGMDHSTATTFYLQNQVQRRWHQPFLKALAITENKLSPLAPSGTLLGTLTKQAAVDTGLTTDTAVVLGAFDHPCAARGTGTLATGDFLLSCGTSWVGFFPVADRTRALKLNLLIDPFLTPTGPWGALFSLPQIGLTIDACIDYALTLDGKSMKVSGTYEKFNRLAARALPGAHGLRLNMRLSPADIKQTLMVMDKQYTSADICRAVMEGMALEIKQEISRLSRAGVIIRRVTMVGGPAESPVWPHILADVTGLNVHLTSGQHAGALGAAILAGMGAGFFKNEREGYRALGQPRRIMKTGLK
jgi:sugar (pentulose or hexulose) kinase